VGLSLQSRPAPLIDLHCHILPAVDDGPANIDFSVAMARTAVDDGTQIIVATPHVRGDFNVEPEAIRPAVDALNRRLEEEQVQLRVLPGAEVGWREAPGLSGETLKLLTLGGADYVLLECPYGKSPADVEGAVAHIAAAGLKTLLAHPERCPLFKEDPDRLATIVEGGAFTSITAASLTGAFGERVQRFAFDLLERGLVHDVASDAHDHLHRPPRLTTMLREVDAALPGMAAHAAWFTVTAPMAILRGQPVEDAPRVTRPRRAAWRRVLRRS
jgi:protein-tyrosine phosphatase